MRWKTATQVKSGLLAPTRPGDFQMLPQSSNPLRSEQPTSDSPGTPVTYVPPAVQFTVDNGIVSTLSLADMRSLYEVFLRSSRVLLTEENIAEDKVYPVEVLMQTTSTDYYKWYTIESGATTQISLLRFEISDLYWHKRETFVIAAGDLLHFQMLKQNIWDSFWSTFFLNGAPTPFKISVSHLCSGVPGYGTRILTRCSTQTTPFLRHSGYSTGRDVEPISVVADHQRPVHHECPCPIRDSHRVKDPTVPHVQHIASTASRSARNRSNIYQLLNPPSNERIAIVRRRTKVYSRAHAEICISSRIGYEL